MKWRREKDYSWALLDERLGLLGRIHPVRFRDGERAYMWLAFTSTGCMDGWTTKSLKDCKAAVERAAKGE